MPLKLVSLASGSKGNATLIISDNTALLVDAGICYTRLRYELRAFGLTADMLDGVIITHEHSDHIKALPKLCEDCKIYAHPKTLEKIFKRQGELKNVADVDNFEGGFSVGDIKVEPFRIPHDAAYPLAYSFCSGNARCSVATDIGIPTVGVLRNIKDSQVVLLEANHDITMLKEGNYPPRLKARILSDKGHLSNDATARIVQRIAGQSEVQDIILGHLSENNNTEDCAVSTVSAALESIGNKDIKLHVAHQNSVSEVLKTI